HQAAGKSRSKDGAGPALRRDDAGDRAAQPAQAGVVESTDSTHSKSLLLGKAPILVAATWPPLNRIIVGMPRTPYLRGVCGFSSILTLATVTRPAISVASSSRNGAIILQGPHHSAQKSTSTGSLARSTTASKLLSLTGVGFITKSSVSSALTLGEPQIRRQGGSRRVADSRDYDAWGWLADLPSRRALSPIW